MPNNFIIVTDRGGHLHDALRLVSQMGVTPQALITTFGPDVDYLTRTEKLKDCKIYSVPLAFFWIGKKRIFNPFIFLSQVFKSVLILMKMRPEFVISTGATTTVIPCYLARCLGSQIIHIENLAQVVNPSIAGRLLYPIATHFFVQWPDLLKRYGEKAIYAGNIV